MASTNPQSDPRAPEHHVDLDATEARQGLRGRHVFVILTVSTLLAVAALFGVWTTRCIRRRRRSHRPPRVRPNPTSDAGPNHTLQTDKGRPIGRPLQLYWLSVLDDGLAAQGAREEAENQQHQEDNEQHLRHHPQRHGRQ